jgi:hypothetical protein
MQPTRTPPELVTALPDSASDPYCGTPLGVEAAWWPNGIDVPGVAAVRDLTGSLIEPLSEQLLRMRP